MDIDYSAKHPEEILNQRFGDGDWTYFDPRSNVQYFGLIKFSSEGPNQDICEILMEEICDQRKSLRLKGSDLSKRLVILNPGLKIDEDRPEGVRPTIIDGVTEVFHHDTLNYEGKVYERGAFPVTEARYSQKERGIPITRQDKEGEARLIWFPKTYEKLGLRTIWYGNHQIYNTTDSNLKYEFGCISFKKKG